MDETKLLGFKYTDFLIEVPPFHLESVPLEWILYHSFSDLSDFTSVRGEFTVDFIPNLNVSKDQQIFDSSTNPTFVKGLLNPFPYIKFTQSDTNTEILLPLLRCIGVAQKETDVLLSFLPHSISPIEGFSLEKPLHWGQMVASMGNPNTESLLVHLLAFFYNNDRSLVRPHCETCQGLYVIKKPQTIPEANTEIPPEAFVCRDCLLGALNYYQELREQNVQLDISSITSEAKDQWKQLIEGGIEIAEQVHDERLVHEFLFFYVNFLMRSQNTTDQDEAAKNLEDIINFAEIHGLKLMDEIARDLYSQLMVKIAARTAKFPTDYHAIPTTKKSDRKPPSSPEKVPDAIEASKVFEVPAPPPKGLKVNLSPVKAPIKPNITSDTSEPSELGVDIPPPVPESSESRTLEFTPPDQIPFDEEAMSLGEALQSLPQITTPIKVTETKKTPGVNKVDEFAIPVPSYRISKVATPSKPPSIASSTGTKEEFPPIPPVPPKEISIPPIPPPIHPKQTSTSVPSTVPPKQVPISAPPSVPPKHTTISPPPPVPQRQIPDSTPVAERPSIASFLPPSSLDKSVQTKKGDFISTLFGKPLFFGVEMNANPVEPKKDATAIFDVFTKPQKSTTETEKPATPLSQVTPTLTQKINPPSATTNLPSSSPSEAPPLATAKISYVSVASEKDSSSKATGPVSLLSQRRGARSVAERKIAICPMCGKIADACICGFMKAKGQ